MKPNNNNLIIIPLLAEYNQTQKYMVFTLKEQNKLIKKLRKLGYRGQL